MLVNNDSLGFLLCSLQWFNIFPLIPQEINLHIRAPAHQPGGSNGITLSCDVASEGDEVTWKFSGEEIDEDNPFEMKKIGPNLLLKDVGTPMLGEYTCWSRGKSMSTYLLLQAEEEEEFDYFLTCRANSYNCTFSCTWNDTKYKLVRLGLGREGGDLCSWVSSTSDKQDGKLHFELHHSLSPYSEESTMLELTAEAIGNDTFLRRIKKFYLHDIIQPDSPQIVKCQELEHYLSVTVRPPCSWSSPDSFFPLEHQVEYRLRDDGQVKCSKPSQLPKKISSLRARSRDLLVQSRWSKWSEWANVKCCLKTNKNQQTSPKSQIKRIEFNN
uniref:Interleukin-12 subunit beta n=1 Tax=Hippocampus comes TaxID=109280 RepID=A0A3Q2YS19_HIPCM